MSEHELLDATVDLRGNEWNYLGILLRKAYKQEQTKIENLTKRFGAAAEVEKNQEKLVFIDELIGKVLA